MQSLPVPTLEYVSRDLKPCYRRHGIEICSAQIVGKAEMAPLASDWALRLAFGRNPQALHIEAMVSLSAHTYPFEIATGS